MDERQKGATHPALTPLSQSQENIWNLERAHPGLPINNICSTLKLSGRLDFPLLQKCVIHLIETVPALRTRITLRDGVPYQYIDDRVPEKVPYFDFSMTSTEGVYQWDIAVTREVMQLVDAPLYYCAIFRQSGDTGGILIKTHHLISDAWSQMILSDRLAQSYMAFISGRAAALSEVPPYARHVEVEANYLQSTEAEADRRYWREVLSSIPETPAKSRALTLTSAIGARKSFPLPERISRAMAAYCRKNRVSPFALFYMALSIYLRRVKGMSRFCVGVPTINRCDHEDKRSVGMFVSTLPFVGELDDTICLDEFNRRLMSAWYSLLRHQKLPYAEIRKIAREVGGTTGPLFDIMLSYQNGQLHRSRDAQIAFEGRWHYSGYQAESLCIHLSSREQENRFLVDYDYLVQVFSAEEISALHQCLMTILEGALDHPDRPICDLKLMDGDEKERVLFTFNRTDAPFPDDRSVAEALLREAQLHPTRVAVIADDRRVTYQALLERARQQALRLYALLPGPEPVIALALPRGAELMAHMVAAALAGCAFVLLDVTAPDERLKDFVGLSGAALVIGEEGVLGRLAGVQARRMTPTALSALPPGEALPAVKPKALCYLVFTSGSTGSPKPVEVEGTSIMNFANSMRALYGRSAMLSICNVGFDAFILESLCSLLGGRTVVISAECDRNNPRALAELIRRYDVGFLATTPSRLSAYLREAEFAGALSGVECIVCGGEPFSAELYRALRMVTQARIVNQYGPSEAAVGVSYKVIVEDQPISIGAPMPNCRIYVLDERMRPLPVGAAGEICIGGVCLARGYRGDPILTAQKFVEDPFRPSERVYRSGDMGVWSAGGELTYLGRNDAQFKLGGQRVEPAEIEARLRAHPAVSDVAVKLVGEGKRALAAYFTSPSGLSGRELISYTAEYLPRAMIPRYAERMDTLPITQNGKVDYRMLPEPAVPKGESAPADAVETELLAIWREVLRDESVSASTDYFLAGGDSLNGGQMLAEVERRFGRAPGMAELYAHPTLRAFAEVLRGGVAVADAAVESESEIPRMADAPFYPLSPAQRNFYIMHRMDASGVAYNTPGAFMPETPLDEDKLEGAFRRLIELDELLRTGFIINGREPVQVIHDSVPFSLERVKADCFERAIEQFVRPFDLARPPLLRAAVWYDEQNRQVLLMDMHHIISDGLSGEITFRRLDALYRGQMPEMPPIRYADYAAYLAARPREALNAHRAYWKEVLRDAPSMLDLPTDHPRPAVFDGRGDRVAFSMDRESSERMTECARRNQATPFAFMMAAFGALLMRLSGQQDVVVGTPVAGRRRRELKNMTGALIYTLPLRLTAGPDIRFCDYLSRVKSGAAQMLDHQDLPFDEIVELSGVQRDMGRNPLFSALFSLLPVDPTALSVGGALLVQRPLGAYTAKMDINLESSLSDGAYHFQLEYASSLYDRASMEMFSSGFLALLAAAVADDQTKLFDLPVVSTADRIRLIERPMRRRTPYDPTPLDTLIDEVAATRPEAEAVTWGEGHAYTFGQLSARAERLAALIQRCGARPGDRIGLILKRDGDLPAAMMAAMKAGCAYVPIDAEYPADRIRYMLRDTESRMVLLGDGVEAPDDLPCEAIPVSEEPEGGFQAPARSIEDLQCVLYTSGSTGHPKGVQLITRSLGSLMVDVAGILDFEGARVLCSANMIFDIFTIETLMALALGKPIAMADEEEMRLPWKMARRMEAHRINVLQLTPSRMQMCMGDEAFVRAMRALRVIILAGEPFTTQMLSSVREAAPDARIINIYGPTETTVFSSYSDLTHSDEVHIGAPVTNARFYALDERGRLLPPGVRGLLYIGGECVTRGYINKPDLTQAQYLPDPFFPCQRMYAAGDIVRLRADGNWVCLGRADRQLKMNGRRIEPDEIAAQIIKSGLVTEAAVAPVVVDGQVKSLRAFVVPRAEYDLDALKRHLTAVLPEYMIPSSIWTIASFPRTASGKTDYLALSGMKEPESAAVPAKADDPTAQAVMEIWRDVLGKNDVSPTLSFFEQGGTSLSALVVLSRYYRLNFSMPLSEFYRHPTPTEQAHMLAGQARSQKPGEDVTPAATHCPSAPAGSGATSPAPTASAVESAASVPSSSAPEATIRPLSGSVRPVPANAPTSFIPLQETAPRPLSGSIRPTHAASTGKAGASGYADAVPATAPIPPKALAVDHAPESAPASSAPNRLIASGTISRAAAETPGVAPTASRPSSLPAPRIGGDVLLTGATGFLGAHLLMELIGAGYRTVCLVRRSGERLYTVLGDYFGDLPDGQRRLIDTVVGDVTLPRLGIPEGTYAELASRVHTVYHCAADVRHYGDESEMMTTNDLGTAHAITFARRAGAAFHYMSTASVSGEYLVAAPGTPALFTEEDLDIGQNWRENIYVKSKVLAEKRVAEAAGAGLRTSVYRVGRLCGRHSDGRFQLNPENNALYRIARGFEVLGAIPDAWSRAPFEVTPVDLCARAIMALRDAPGVYHLVNPDLTTLGKLLEPLKRLPTAEFERQLREALAPGGSPYVSALAEYYFSGVQATIQLSSRRTVEALSAKGFVWPTLDAAAIRRGLSGGGGINA